MTRLNAWRPQLLVGYASMLRLLAEEQLAGRLAIDPRFVFSASEVLAGSTRELAATAWERAPRDVYAATETGGIAAECGRHPGLHGVDAAGWQIVQRPDGVEILLVRPHRVDIAALAARVRAAIARQDAVAPRVAIREVAAVPPTAAGKAPLITRAG